MTELADDDEAGTDKREFQHRRGDKDYRRRQLERLVTRLENYYECTDPAKGDASAAGKDFAARDALSAAGDIVELFAGWAVDHVIGKAVIGQDLLPWHPAETRKSPEYVLLREQADQHQHERAGSAINTRYGWYKHGYGPRVIRQTLLNLIQTNSGGASARNGSEDCRSASGSFVRRSVAGIRA